MSRPTPEYHYIAYIDESGDPGLRAVRPRTPGGASEWIVVAGAVIQAGTEPEVRRWVADMMRAINSHQLRDIHFRKLKPEKKALVSSYLAQQKVRLFAIASNKQNMQGYQNPKAAQI